MKKYHHLAFMYRSSNVHFYSQQKDKQQQPSRNQFYSAATVYCWSSVTHILLATFPTLFYDVDLIESLAASQAFWGTFPRKRSYLIANDVSFHLWKEHKSIKFSNLSHKAQCIHTVQRYVHACTVMFTDLGFPRKSNIADPVVPRC
jgi:hypothetical protein